jgi:hypothetical protein
MSGGRSGLIASPVERNHGHRALGVMHDLAGDGAEVQMRETAAASRANNDQVRVARCVNERL